MGGHVGDYMNYLQEEDAEKYQKHFSKYIAAGIPVRGRPQSHSRRPFCFGQVDQEAGSGQVQEERKNAFVCSERPRAQQDSCFAEKRNPSVKISFVHKPSCGLIPPPLFFFFSELPPFHTLSFTIFSV